MQRRHFCLGLASLMPTLATAYPSVPYIRENWPNIEANADKIVLNWRASWSLTCQRKADILSKLVAENPEYEKLTFVDIDWDTFGPSVWAQRLEIKRRSTLVALRNKRVIARIENQPEEDALKAFLDQVLNA